MKTTVEINGYLIVIEESEGNISVSATKDEEVVEEFTIEVEEGQGFEGQDDDDVQGFGEFGQEEEEDFEDEGREEEDDDFEEEEEEDLSALESFQSFINKKKK